MENNTSLIWERNYEWWIDNIWCTYKYIIDWICM